MLATVTVTVSVTDTATVTVGFPDSTQGHPTPTRPVPTHPHPHPTPSHTFSPPPPGTGNGNGNGNGNSGSNGNGNGNGNGGSGANLCCDMAGQANLLANTTLARSLNINLSGKTGLAGELQFFSESSVPRVIDVVLQASCAMSSVKEVALNGKVAHPVTVLPPLTDICFSLALARSSLVAPFWVTFWVD